MLITVAADENSLESNVAKRFGHANFYLTYNTETGNHEAIINADHDHSHSMLYNLLDKGTEVFIVGNIGPHAFEIIKTETTKVFLARKMTVQEAIRKYMDGELQELTEPTVKKSINHSH